MTEQAKVRPSIS